MSLDEGVLDKDTVLMRDKHFFLSKHNAADTISHGRHSLTIEFADILMSIRAENIVLIFVKSEIEGGAMLDDGFIE